MRCPTSDTTYCARASGVGRPTARASFSRGLALVVGVVGVLASGLGCSRTQPEPVPASSSSGASATGGASVTRSTEPKSIAPGTGTGGKEERGSAGAEARCIDPMPASAPAIPPPASAAACPPDPEGIPKAEIAKVTFVDADKKPQVEVELAKNAHDVERGLMYRRTMPEQHGMLFRLDGHRIHTFWMHNTCIPLDMHFIDEDGTIVGIVEAAAPLTDTSRSVACPSRYVLEVNAGWSRKHGVRAGQKIALPEAIR